MRLTRRRRRILTTLGLDDGAAFAREDLAAGRARLTAAALRRTTLGLVARTGFDAFLRLADRSLARRNAFLARFNSFFALFASSLAARSACLACVARWTAACNAAFNAAAACLLVPEEFCFGMAGNRETGESGCRRFPTCAGSVKVEMAILLDSRAGALPMRVRHTNVTRIWLPLSAPRSPPSAVRAPGIA